MLLLPYSAPLWFSHANGMITALGARAANPPVCSTFSPASQHCDVKMQLSNRPSTPSVWPRRTRPTLSDAKYVKARRTKTVWAELLALGLNAVLVVVVMPPTVVVVVLAPAPKFSRNSTEAP